MTAPSELSAREIRKFMLAHDGRVTNYMLVKHFRPFLTNTVTQIEARKHFKTCVNLLATIRTEDDGQRYLYLRKTYQNADVPDEVVREAVDGKESHYSGGAEPEATTPPIENTPDTSSSLSVDFSCFSPVRSPPPYIPPPPPPPAPLMSPARAGVAVNDQSVKNYGECVSEFVTAIHKFTEESSPAAPPKPEQWPSAAENVENIPPMGEARQAVDEADNSISVKEATRKFNRMASEEEMKSKSTPTRRKSENIILENEQQQTTLLPPQPPSLPEPTMAHSKAKEWIVAMAKSSYHELAKLANDHPELVKLQEPATGYTALHWAAKHGNEDVVKLIAGTHKADVNARSHGGYTPLHLAIQFGRENIFELLWNVYKANRDLMDWSGNKPLDYSQQRPSVSASTCSKIKARKKPAVEKDLGFLRIGSLNVRVKRTTEAFSSFLGVGHGSGSSVAPAKATAQHHQQQRAHHHRHHHHRSTGAHTLYHANGTRSRHQIQNPNHPQRMTMPHPPLYGQPLPTRASVPSNMNMHESVHKSWSSVDNITHSDAAMPPPASLSGKPGGKRKASKKHTDDSARYSVSSSSNSSTNLYSGYSSMPTTPNQARANMNLRHTADNNNASQQLNDSDSDSAFGFGSNWSVNGGRGLLRNETLKHN